MNFLIEAEHLTNFDKKFFVYDLDTNSIREYSNEASFQTETSETPTPVSRVSATTPIIGKNKNISTLKIQLGLSCNYTCTYCSQKFVERPPETSKKDITAFIKKLTDSIDLSSVKKVEFWGGEPFVYWKTLQPLVIQLRQILPTTTFQTITNGSLIDLEKIEWIEKYDIMVAISHDGPGQDERQDDPLKDNFDNIRELVRRRTPVNKFSFNAVLNKNNPSRVEIIKYFENLFPDVPNIMVGEMGFVTTHHDDGLYLTAFSPQEFIDLRRSLWLELRESPHMVGRMVSISQQIDSLVKEEQHHINLYGQGCGMDKKSQIAVDLHGNVITCQNVSIKETSGNGQSHAIGTLDDISAVKLDTGTHWSHRPKCTTCPVLRACLGTCMYLSPDHFEDTCEIAYNTLLPTFALAFETITGYVPVYIHADHLPEMRRDVWGTRHEVSSKPAKKVFQIKSV